MPFRRTAGDQSNVIRLKADVAGSSVHTSRFILLISDGGVVASVAEADSPRTGMGAEWVIVITSVLLKA